MHHTLNHSAKGERIYQLEPHVSYFNINSSDRKSFIFPFQVMGYMLGFFILMGLYFAVFKDDPSVGGIVTWICCIFAPFYLPGVYHYRRSFLQDRSTEIEVDSRNRMLRYINREKGQDLLFHAEQVQRCDIYVSAMLPYLTEYLCIELAGGRKIVLSGLIATPRELAEELELDCNIHRRYFNPVP